MKVLITGATGFIGREIVSELVGKVSQIYQVGNRHSNLQTENARFFKVDITDSRNFYDLRNLGEVDVVIHSAGLAHQFGEISKTEFEKTNVEGTKNILELAVSLKAAHFILISSTAVYGTKKKSGSDIEIIDETAGCSPQTGYAESKLEAENAAITVCERNKMNLTIFRLAPVLGEGNTGNAARMIEAIDKKRFVWIGKGENYKSLIYKKDVARACGQILRENKTNGVEIFNLAAEPILMRDFVGRAAKCLKTEIPEFSIPAIFLEKIFLLNERVFRIKKIARLAGTIEKWLSDDVYSAEKFRREYNFKPATSIAEALEKQIDSYLKQKKTSGVD